MINMSHHLVGSTGPSALSHHLQPHHHHSSHSHPTTNHTNHLSTCHTSVNYPLSDPIGSSGASTGLSTLTTLTNFANNAGNTFAAVGSTSGATGSPISIDPFKFTQNQINCICETLLQSKKFDRLSQFLCILPPQMYTGAHNPNHYHGSAPASSSSGNSMQTLATREMLLRCKAHIAHSSNNFKDLYEILEETSFSSCLHSELQRLWHEAHYKESEIMRGRKLGAVDKYRLRRKFALPKTIWDGDEYVYCFKEKSRQALKDCYKKNRYVHLLTF
jgi:hypothetical protein